MSRPEKAPEPSMEEILASIRKIIAEEPIGSRAGAAPAPATDAPRPAAASAGLPQARGRGEPGSLPFPVRDAASRDSGDGEMPYSVEDALADLIEDAPPRNSGRADAPNQEPALTPRPAAAAGDDAQRPGWLFARPNTVPAPPSVAGAANPGLPKAGAPLGPLDGLRSTRPEPAMRAPSESPIKPLAESPLTGARPAAPVASDLGVPKPAVPIPAAKASPLPDIGMPAPVVRAEAPQPSAPVAPAPAPVPAAKIAPTEPVAVAAPIVEAPASPAAPAAREPAKELSPLDALAKGLAATKVAAPAPVSVPAPVVSAPVATPAPAVVPEIAAQVAAAPSPAAPAAVTTPEPAVVAALGSRSLEDTVAELLRPMLREWLNTNMPRIVEKALRVELAAHTKRPGTKEPG